MPSAPTCRNCGAEYTPHPAYRNRTQACDGPNGYCAGVIDGREESADRIAELERERGRISKRLREEGESLLENGKALEEAFPDQALEGRARVMAGLSLVELAASWPREKRHATHMAELAKLMGKVEALLSAAVDNVDPALAPPSHWRPLPKREALDV